MLGVVLPMAALTPGLGLTFRSLSLEYFCFRSIMAAATTIAMTIRISTRSISDSLYTDFVESLLMPQFSVCDLSLWSGSKYFGSECYSVGD